ncbi:MAG TPA: cupin-like domain-containing protein [Vicinamibacterales bacterium]|jgi:hypothetical protein
MDQYLRFNPTNVRERFDRAPFLIEHNLADHPLLQLPRLMELSAALPAESVEYNAGNLPVNQDPKLTPRTGLTVSETLRRIEECNSWMVLKYVGQDPDYSRLLDACLDQIQPVVDDICPGMTERHAFIFVSSPGAVTPYHVDFEYNFLLQVRGEKDITVFDPFDRSLLSEEQRERFCTGAPRNLVFRDHFSDKGHTFHLRPGVGVHVPLTSPHWVKVGPSVSISFSITFQSRVSDRRIGAHKTNALLRRLGMSPEEVGQSEMRDSLKYTAHRILRRVQATGQKLAGMAHLRRPAATVR